MHGLIFPDRQLMDDAAGLEADEALLAIRKHDILHDIPIA